MNFLDTVHKKVHKKKKIFFSRNFNNKFFSQQNNLLIGVSNDLNHLLSLQINTDDDHRTAQFLLYIHEIDFYNMHIPYYHQVIPLFSNNGSLNISIKETETKEELNSEFNVFVVETLESDDISYIIYGYQPNSDNLFIYFTIIFRDIERFPPLHISFPSNSNTFNWDPESSLILNPQTIMMFTAISSLKTVIIDKETKQAKFRSFDVDRYFSKTLGDSFRFIESYTSNIICSSESSLINTNQISMNNGFLIYIGYIFYNQNNNHWKLIAEIQEFPISGEKRIISKLSKSFERRPATNTMKTELKTFFEELKNMTNLQNDTLEKQRFHKINNITRINETHFINVDEYNICILDK